MASVLTVNKAVAPAAQTELGSGIDKRPSAEPLAVRAPGPRRGGLGSGVVGDSIGNAKFHGGDDQAVYAYAREDLDSWQAELDRELTNGMFGENLTTTGVAVTDCLIGERWAVGDDGLVLEVTSPRTPARRSPRGSASQVGSRPSPPPGYLGPTCASSPPGLCEPVTASRSSTVPTTP